MTAPEPEPGEADYALVNEINRCQVEGVHPIGVGMPTWLHLNHFAEVIRPIFDAPIVLVGSALTSRSPRDIDVRVLLTDDQFGSTLFEGMPGTKWAGMSMALSALGKQLTGREIDCQVQSATCAKRYQDNPHRKLLVYSTPPATP